MGLYQRVTANDATKISIHRFGAALRQMAAGQLTRQQIIDTFALAGTDVTEFDALMASYNGLPQNNVVAGIAKASWLNRMEDVFILCETGDYTEAKAKTALGF
jgi:hypothetical protein